LPKCLRTQTYFYLERVLVLLEPELELEPELDLELPPELLPELLVGATLVPRLDPDDGLETLLDPPVLLPLLGEEVAGVLILGGGL
jgi:hypothetical protein